MGCDIHLFVEKKINNIWHSADKWVASKYEDEPELSVDYDDRFYSGRNYDLFAILANVRNGHGFAGVPTGYGFNPISMPKGLPSDCDPRILDESNRWGVDGHSHSWHLISDILSFDWIQQSQKLGVVSAIEFEEWDRLKGWNPGPKSYCGGISGPKINQISQAEMQSEIDRIFGNPRVYGPGRNDRMETLKVEHSNTYCQVTWEESYASLCQNFWWDTIPKLLQVGKPDEVRIVFWFDN